MVQKYNDQMDNMKAAHLKETELINQEMKKMKVNIENI